MGVLGAAVALLAGASSAAAAPGWLAPVGLSAPGRDASVASVEMDAGGNSLAVWQRGRTSGPGNSIQFSYRPAGGTFPAAVDIAPIGSEPSLAMAPSGEAVVVWRVLESEVEETGDEEFLNTSEQVLKASTMSPGGVFSSPVDLYRAPPTLIKVVGSTPTTEQQGGTPQKVRLALNEAGALAVAWQENDPEEPAPTVMAVVRNAGGGLSGATRVSPTPETDKPAEQPEVGIDGAGAATVVWQYEGGAGYTVQEASKPPAGAFDPPETLNDALGSEENAGFPVVGVDAAGDAMVLWRQVDPDESTVQVAARPAGDEFGEPTIISTPGAAAFSPEVAVAPNGSALAVWIENLENNVVRAAAGVAGGALGPPQELSSESEEAQFKSTVINSSGAAAVSWLADLGTQNRINASVRAPGAGFGPVLPISGTSTEFLHADLGVDPFGDVTAVWPQAVGSSDIVQMAGYDAFVPELRDVSIPATGVVGQPLSFSAGAFDVWPPGTPIFAFGDGTAESGSAVSHAYSAPGSYEVTVTVADPAGTSVSRSGTVVIGPRTGFTLGKLALNKKKGTATLPVSVEESGSVSIKGKGIKGVSAKPPAPGQVKLKVKAVGKTLKKLKKKGKVKITLTVTFTPSGGGPASKQAKGTLRKKLG